MHFAYFSTGGGSVLGVRVSSQRKSKTWGFAFSSQAFGSLINRTLKVFFRTTDKNYRQYLDKGPTLPVQTFRELPVSVIVIVSAIVI